MDHSPTADPSADLPHKLHRSVGRASAALGSGRLRLPYGQQHRAALGFDSLRVFLGTALSVRGALLLARPEWLSQTLGSALLPVGLIGLVGALHLVGGLALTSGYRTRLAALSQLVPVVGALWVHDGDRLASADQSPELIGLVGVALVSLVLFGAGPWSLDHALRK